MQRRLAKDNPSRQAGRGLESLLLAPVFDFHGHREGIRPWVIFAETQYLKDWEVHFKSLVDSCPEVRFVESGSAAAALKMKSRESGAGRFTDFVLPPLTLTSAASPRRCSVPP
ncbi:MAG TPA: AAA family ATPase [Rectinemataceae bacterium]|nr:AAA family ATPase [Rectinemataceae bacterium]